MTSDLNPSAYEAFAPFYDGFTAASDYEKWTTQALEIASRHGMSGRTVLDLACGTGNSFMPLLRRGFEVTAADASPAMLAEASLKAPGVRLLQADLRQLPVLGRFDLVTCIDDSLNYLPGADELAAAFRGIAANLAPKGVAIFDLNTLRAYRETFARDSVSETGGTVYAWRGQTARDAPEGCVATAVIEVFAPCEGGLYERVTTRHDQRHFPRALVVELLARASLQCKGVHGALDSGEVVDEGDEAAHLKVVYIAKHMEGGASE